MIHKDIYGSVKRVVCISAVNVRKDENEDASYSICKKIRRMLEAEKIPCDILDMREYNLTPCTGCGQCAKSGICGGDRDFNRMYEIIGGADWCFVVSPRYAPIPVSLCILLGKLEQVSLLYISGNCPNKKNGHGPLFYRDKTGSGKDGMLSPLAGRMAGIISHGSGAGWGLENCKTMVNDTIANTLEAVGMRVVPFNLEWDTGIALPETELEKEKEGDRSVQEYERDEACKRLKSYVKIMVQTSRTLYALRP